MPSLGSAHALVGKAFPDRSVLGMDLAPGFTSIARQLLHDAAADQRIQAQVCH